MVKYIIVGKKWFDKTYGNTYHAVKVLEAKTNKELFRTPMTYGYGDQWQHTALTELVKRKKIKEADRHDYEKRRKKFTFVDAGFGLKRDLKWF